MRAVQNVEEAEAHFQRGVRAIFSFWTAIYLVRQHESGGVETEEKVEDLEAGVVEQFDFRRNRVGVTQPVMEDMFMHYFDTELLTVVEDGSVRSVCSQLFNLWDECRAGRYELVERLEELAAQFKKKFPDEEKHPRRPLSSSEGEEGELEDPAQEAAGAGGKEEEEEEEDEDSWTTVSYKK